MLEHVWSAALVDVVPIPYLSIALKTVISNPVIQARATSNLPPVYTVSSTLGLHPHNHPHHCHGCSSWLSTSYAVLVFVKDDGFELSIH